MKKTESKKSAIPKWIHNYPFPSNEKKVVVITREKELSTLYGYEGHQVCAEIVVSTDNLTFNEWTLPPGAHYAPPGLHLHGDECYYVHEGDPVAFNPEKGEVFQLHAGDTLLIPQGTRHQIFNFTNRVVKAIAINAPKVWEDDGIGTDIPPVKKPKVYKGIQYEEE